MAAQRGHGSMKGPWLHGGGMAACTAGAWQHEGAMAARGEHGCIARGMAVWGGAWLHRGVHGCMGGCKAA